MLRRAAAALAILSATAALAQEGPPATPSAPIAFAPVVDQMIDRVIIPGYTRLAETAATETGVMEALCTTPGDATLADARTAFADLAVAWSGVEMFRVGPARADNRYERLFFWPDRKGLGLRQVQGIIAEEDATAIDVTTLRGKSVAVQGLLALEYVLFGTDSDGLASAPPDAFRCRYGATIAGAIATTAGEMLTGWTAPDGYAAVMRNPGAENPVYRSHGEVVQDMLRAAREMIQIVRDIKIARPIGKAPASAVPTQAPFWRSDLTIATIRANIDAVNTLVSAGGIGAILPASATWMTGSLAFELSSANTALARLTETGAPWADIVKSADGHDTLAYTLIPLGSAFEILEQRMPVALGLTMGFNTLDGD